MGLFGSCLALPFWQQGVILAVVRKPFVIKGLDEVAAKFGKLPANVAVLHRLEPPQLRGNGVRHVAR